MYAGALDEHYFEGFDPAVSLGRIMLTIGKKESLPGFWVSGNPIHGGDFIANGIGPSRQEHSAQYQEQPIRPKQMSTSILIFIIVEV